MNPRLRHGIGLLRAGLPLLPMALIAILLFLWAYHPAMLDPTQLGWVLRGGDNGENALGMHAFLHQADGRGTRRCSTRRTESRCVSRKAIRCWGSRIVGLDGTALLNTPS